MLFVIALGGNALLQRGQPLEAEVLKKNVKAAAKVIAELAGEHQVLVVHGNGPQVGLLALQAEAYKTVHPYPLDILGAESQGMIGYLLQQEIDNYHHDACVTLLTQVVVDKADPAFKQPTKPIGPVYTAEQAEAIVQEHDWVLKKEEGDYLRRVVPSPKPCHVCELSAIESLLAQRIVVIAGGGGGIPCLQENGHLVGVEAVVDKDLTAALLAQKLDADQLVILTDTDYVYRHWGEASADPIKRISADEISALSFAEGSMQPKVEAAVQFVRHCKRPAYIGNLHQLQAIVTGVSGTKIINQ